MLEHLVSHALQNVWCSPRQDNLHILQLHRLTAKYGSLGVVKAMGRDISLPTTSKRYHVYQIGQISPAYMGVLQVKPYWTPERWTTFSTAINASNTQVDLYTEKGIMLARFKAHYMFTSDRNLIVAIEILPKIAADLNTESLFIRFYKNAHFTTVADSTTVETLVHYGEIPLSSDRITYLAGEYNKYASLEGYVTSYVNGFVVDKLDAYTVKVGDVVEFLYDSTIYKVLTLNASTLPVFISEMDTCLKYIIHHKSIADNFISFHDDIDIDVVYSKVGTRFKGGYYHKNLLMSHRMLTHRDYSLPVDHVKRSMDYIQELDTSAPKEYDQFKIRLKFKEHAVKRPLIFDHNRIFELYKLDDESLVRALTGTEATVDNWHAAHLEKSMYTAIMEMKYENITLDAVQKAYGYNGVTKVVAESPLKTELISGRQQAVLPMGYRINSEVYEYDSNGYLLGHNYNQTEDDHYALNNDCRLIEPIVGKALPNNGDIYGLDNLPIPKYDYRVYMTYKINGVVDSTKWTDVTGTNHYRIEDGILKWNNLEIDQWLCVRSDITFYAKDYEVLELSGVLRFKLMETIDGQEVVMSVPRGETDIFINGKSSIANLDYIVNFPYVYINNTRYLNRPVLTEVQNIHVRMTGFCNKDLTLETIDDFGFVQHGALSDNQRFNIRDDKVLRMTVDGKLVHRDQVIFDENSTAISVIDARNGQPYQVRDYVIPVRGLINENTYTYRNTSLAVDKAVSDYLTLKLGNHDKGPLSAIPERYKLVSPFLNRVIYRLLHNQITDNDISKNMNLMWIESNLANDLYLLDADPIRKENQLSKDLVIVAPHRYNGYVELSILKYRFLDKVISIYCQVDMELSQFVTVNKEL